MSREAWEALAPALKYANFTAADVVRIMAGYGACIWNVGNLCWVLTMANQDDEIEVLLCGGQRARECFPYWEQAMLAEPAHKGRVIRVDGRKGWGRYLKDWDCDAAGVLTKRVE